MAINLNNEEIGISAEIAIANTFNVSINEAYLHRANMSVINYFKKINIADIFEKEGIPIPIKHIAEGQNPVDFILMNHKSLSVKTNQDDIGKAAPQIIGQPTSKTYFNYLKENVYPNFDVENYLKEYQIEDNYQSRANLFKEISINHIDKMINEYWKNIFDCDYLILFYNIVSQDGHFRDIPLYKVFGKYGNFPDWDKSKFSFTKTVEAWKESCTLKYNNVSIGNFQVHNNRDCFKFRFIMKSIMKLINNCEI